VVCGALVAWAGATADLVRIPAVHSPWFGLALLLAGATIGVAGARLFPHPVYTGFCIVCAGVSIAVGSASGLWLVSPIVALSCTALALWGRQSCPMPLNFLHSGFVGRGFGPAAGLLPGADCLKASIDTRFPFLGSPGAQCRFQKPSDIGQSCLRARFPSCPAAWRAAPGQVLPQAGSSSPTGNDRLRFYLFVLLPWLALYEVILAIGIPPDAISGMSRFEQRLPVLEWSQIFYASTYILTLSAPLFAKTRSDLRAYSVRALWTMLIAYPAFLLIPLIAPKRPFTPHTLPGRVLLWERTLDSPVAAFPSFHVIWAMLAAVVFARRWPRLKGLFYAWAILVSASCVSTSQHSILDVVGGAITVALVIRGPQIWAAVRGHAERGPWPIMSRGLFAGVAAFLGLCLAETMAGAGAQTTLFGAGAWLIVAALAVGVPAHPRSRVYPMCWSVAITLILTRLWLLSAPLHLIAGLYFILAGLGRFVEEAWRGKLRSQWTAVASVIAGVLITALGRSAPAPYPHFTWNTLLPAFVFGVIVAIVAGRYRESHLSF
jgi:hypothetical protein